MNATRRTVEEITRDISHYSIELRDPRNDGWVVEGCAKRLNELMRELDECIQRPTYLTERTEVSRD